SELAVGIGAKNAPCLDTLGILLAQFAIELLDAFAETPQVIELSLSFGSLLRLGIRARLGAVFGVLVLPTGLGTAAGARGLAARHLPVEAAQIFEAMQPGLVDIRIGVGLQTPPCDFVFVFAETPGDGVGQCPPVESVPFRDQRDVAGLVVNFPQSQLSPDGERERLVR